MINKLDHVNIDTDDLDETIAFYQGVLGLEARAKPSGKPGVWFYSGDHAVIHVTVVDQRAGSHGGNVDHIAFQADDRDGLVQALAAAGIEHEITPRPDMGLTQITFADPNSIPIELTFTLVNE